MWKTLSLAGKKIMGQTPNNFTIIKSITIILVYISRLKKNLSCFSLLSLSLPHTHTHTHTLIISFKGSNTLFSSPWLSFRRRQPYTLSSLAIFLKVAIPYSLLPLAFLPSENPFSLSQFHALFSLSPQGGPLGQNSQILCSIVYL